MEKLKEDEFADEVLLDQLSVRVPLPLLHTKPLQPHTDAASCAKEKKEHVGEASGPISAVQINSEVNEADKISAEKAEVGLIKNDSSAVESSSHVSSDPLSSELTGCSRESTSVPVRLEQSSGETVSERTHPITSHSENNMSREQDLPVNTHSSQPSSDFSSQTVEEKGASKTHELSSTTSVKPTTEAKQQLGHHRHESERTSSLEDSVAAGYLHSRSLRRSARQREKSEKMEASSSSLVSNTESEDSQSSSSTVRRRYKTRYRRKSETEEEEEAEESSERDEQRELRSSSRRYRTRSYNSSSERMEQRELRSRTRREKRDNTVGSEANRNRRTSDDQKETMSVREQSPPLPLPSAGGGPGRKKGKASQIVPTLQAFEDESNEDIGSTEELGELPRALRSRSKMSISAVKDMAQQQKAQSQRKKRGHEEDENVSNAVMEKEGSGKKESEGYVRSVSLPPFKVARTSPTSSPTERPLPGGPLVTRSISYSPPGNTMVTKKKPTLTKDELLAMVRAKKRGSNNGAAPQLESPLERAAEAESGVERGGVAVAQVPRVNMGQLMFNFHQHMQARKANDGGWRTVVHPPYSLRNPPPPPPGPPPSSLTQQIPVLDDQLKPSLTTPVKIDLKKADNETESCTIFPKEVTEVYCEHDSVLKTEDGVIERVIGSAELQASEDILSILVQDTVVRFVAERVEAEETVTIKLLDSLEEQTVEERVREAIKLGVQEKVAELIFAEEVLQERAVETVEEAVTAKVLAAALAEGVNQRVIELIQAELILQERVVEALLTMIVGETMSKLTEEETGRAAKCQLLAEVMLQEEATELAEKEVLGETICCSLEQEIKRKVAEMIKSEEFLQERATTVVEDQTLEQVVYETQLEAVEREMTMRIESQIVCAALDTVENNYFGELESEIVAEVVLEGAVIDLVIEDKLLGEFETFVVEEIAMEGVVIDLVTAKTLAWLSEEIEGAVVEEREGAMQEMVDRTIGKMEEVVSEWVVVESEGTVTAETVEREQAIVLSCLNTVEESQINSLMDSVTDTVADECLVENLILEMESIVAEQLQCDFFDEAQAQVVQDLVQEEQTKLESAVVEVSMAKLEEMILSELQSAFAQELMAEAMAELEEKVVNIVEEDVMQYILNLLYTAILLHDMEINLTKKTEDLLLNGFLDSALEEVAARAERVMSAEEKVLFVITEEVLQKAEACLAGERAEGEESITAKAEEEVLEGTVGELFSAAEGTIVAELTEEEMVTEVENKTCETLAETLLTEALNGHAGEWIEAQEKLVSETENVVMRDTEGECVSEMEEAAFNELATVDELQEMVLRDIEEMATQEEVFGETAADELERVVMDDIESEAAMLAAAAELENHVTYEVTQVFPESLVAPDSTQTTSTHVHEIDSAEESNAMEAQLVYYEVTEIVPDAVSPLKAQKMLTHIHFMDSEPLVGEEKPGSEDFTRSLSQESDSSAYVHVIDTPPLSTSNPSNETELATSLTDKLSSDPEGRTNLTNEDVSQLNADSSEKETPSQVEPAEAEILSSEADSTYPPPPTLPSSLSSAPVVPSASLPKYISQHLQLRPAKLFPPAGVTQPTLLPSFPFLRVALETPPTRSCSTSANPAFVAPSSSCASPPKQDAVAMKSSQTCARYRRKRSKSVARSVTTSSRQLRPRTRSQSAVSEAPPTVNRSTSPLSAPSPSRLTELALSSITGVDIPSVSPDQVSNTSPPQSPIKPLQTWSNICQQRTTRSRKRLRSKKSSSPVSSSCPLPLPSSHKQPELAVKIPWSIISNSGSVGEESNRSTPVGKGEEVNENGREEESCEKDDVFTADEVPVAATTHETSLAASQTSLVASQGAVDSPITEAASSSALDNMGSLREAETVEMGEPPRVAEVGESESERDSGRVATSPSRAQSPQAATNGSTSHCSVHDTSNDCLIEATGSLMEYTGFPQAGFSSSVLTTEEGEGELKDTQLTLGLSKELASPEASPSTRNTRSPTTSIDSMDNEEEEEEMVLRLEASFSSAPETDSDDQEMDKQEGRRPAAVAVSLGGATQEREVEKGEKRKLEPDQQVIEPVTKSSADIDDVNESNIDPQIQEVEAKTMEGALIGEISHALHSTSESSTGQVTSSQEAMGQVDSPLCESREPFQPSSTPVESAEVTPAAEMDVATLPGVADSPGESESATGPHSCAVPPPLHASPTTLREEKSKISSAGMTHTPKPFIPAQVTEELPAEAETPKSTSPYSDKKSRTVLDKAQVAELLSTAHQDLMSAPLPLSKKSRSRTPPSLSERSPRTPTPPANARKETELLSTAHQPLPLSKRSRSKTPPSLSDRSPRTPTPPGNARKETEHLSTAHQDFMSTRAKSRSKTPPSLSERSPRTPTPPSNARKEAELLSTAHQPLKKSRSKTPPFLSERSPRTPTPPPNARKETELLSTAHQPLSHCPKGPDRKPHLLCQRGHPEPPHPLLMPGRRQNFYLQPTNLSKNPDRKPHLFCQRGHPEPPHPLLMPGRRQNFYLQPTNLSPCPKGPDRKPHLLCQIGHPEPPYLLVMPERRQNIYLQPTKTSCPHGPSPDRKLHLHYLIGHPEPPHPLVTSERKQNFYQQSTKTSCPHRPSPDRKLHLHYQIGHPEPPHPLVTSERRQNLHPLVMSERRQNFYQQSTKTSCPHGPSPDRKLHLHYQIGHPEPPHPLVTPGRRQWQWNLMALCHRSPDGWQGTVLQARRQWGEGDCGSRSRMKSQTWQCSTPHFLPPSWVTLSLAGTEGVCRELST